MPTLTRLILIAAVIVALLYGGMWGLVMFVRPTIVELSVEIPPNSIDLKPWPYE